MLDKIFSSIFGNSNATISVTNYLLCILVSLIAGVVLAFIYTYKNKYTKSFVVTLAMLPSVVCVVIMMVNGNIGTGVAVAGAFSLVRFRSVPGTAREIGGIFLAMAVGLITGMGYLALGLLTAVLLGFINLIYNATNFGNKKIGEKEKVLRITVPEDLEFSNAFEDVFSEFLEGYETLRIKTTNMGSLYKITYNITFKNSGQEKAFIDKLRCRNGNLEINLSRQDASVSDL